MADVELGAELAEIGVILLMFGVGLHFSLKDLMSVRALAIPGAVVQIGFATLLGAGLGLLLGWSLFGSILFGLALSVASTVVLLKALQDRRLLESERGRIAVGWLIVEDLAMVLALVLVPAIASLGGTSEGLHDPFVSFVTRLLGMEVGIWGILGMTLLKIAAFVGFMLVVGRRVIPWALHATAHTGSRELFRLAVLAIALGVALGSSVLFGVSLALGAFFAGMILSESELSHRAAQETLPLRDAFAVLFFVSVGMLFDPSIIVTQPLLVLATVFIIVIGKSLAAFWIVILFRRPISTALTISASLAQIGEFSFILASMGVALAIMPPEGQDLILAGALISIVLNPLTFFVLDLVKPRLEARVAARRGETVEAAAEVRQEPSMAAQGPATTDAPSTGAVDRGEHGADDDTGEPSHQTGHTVLVGYGQVGRIVAAGIKADGGGLVVIEDSDHDVAAARAEGFEVIFGNAASEQVLKLANLGAAKALLVAISNGFEAGSVCESGRKLNPGIAIISRAYSEEEETFLRNLGATTVIRGEQEIGKGILAYLRGEAGKGDAPVLPEESKLPTAENILATAAMGAALTEAALAEAPKPEADAAIPETPAEDAATDETVPETADTAVDAAAVVATQAEASLPEAVGVEAATDAPGTSAADAPHDARPDEIAVIEAPLPAEPEAETSPASDDVIILPPPAEVVPVEETPSVGEPPAAIDEIVVPPKPETGEDSAETAPAGEALAHGTASGEGATEAGDEKAVPDVEPEPKN